MLELNSAGQILDFPDTDEVVSALWEIGWNLCDSFTSTFPTQHHCEWYKHSLDISKGLEL